ncbi:DnaJ-domain-containing protein [Metschnikowia bicuspidata]|uniref:DnaJ homolog 1, mitochondrial n=1 Tax=Metschnikowia bicuspidata TaxID=27322 RepID=A0A4P9ZD72_9ASCO|nr:DnaJ-domain-containing protein [Metschnikowia bicuspidata]
MFRYAIKARLRPLVCRATVRFPRHSFHSSSRALIDFDPYKTLGVDKNSSAADIKKAYYQLVKKYHPDVNKDKDNDKRFHKIQESYELLSDTNKRAQYDQFGASAFDSNGNANPHGGNPFGAQGNPFSGMGFDFEDLFKHAFNGANGGGAREGRGGFVTEHVGDNIEVLKSIAFRDAVFGTKVSVNYKAVDSCRTCSGTGLKEGKKKNTCPSCHGVGQTIHVLGGFQMASTCNTCHGSGVTIHKNDVCKTCHGKGVGEIPKSSEVDLPCGISDGSRLRIPGGGDAPYVTKDPYNQTRNGDLIVRVHVQKDKQFERVNNNIVLNHEIPMTTASLGGEIVVPTIDGENIKLKIRPGVQSGRKISISDKGVPINRNLKNRGDMDVLLKVKTLTPQTPLQTALLEALADAFDDKSAQRTHNELKLDQEAEDATTEKYDEKNLSSLNMNRIGKILGKFFNFKEKDQK